MARTLPRHFAGGLTAKLDYRLASDAADAVARAEKRESEARIPFLKKHKDRMLTEASVWRKVAARDLELRSGRTAPYLVRGLIMHEGDFSVEFQGDQLVVSQNSMGHHLVPVQRRPIVVYLDRSPKQACVGVSMTD